MKIAVVIPIYKMELLETEKTSLAQCRSILDKYDIIFACPKGFDPNGEITKSKKEEFNIKYFKSLAGYNQLMLQSHFYERFLNYDYILIYQLDAFVFRDELEHWCAKDYDYIGAPWIASNNTFSKLLKPFTSSRLKKREPIFYKVGNGGFSLRKTKTFFNISTELRDTINYHLEGKTEELYAIEDVFWSLKVPEYYPEFSIPDYKEAIKFAIDRKPAIALKMNNNKLPFGCHGITKPKVAKFWAPIIKKAHLKN